MGEQTGDKTEEPTPHRLREAREKGQVAKSKEITTAFLLLGSYLVFRFSGGMIWDQIAWMTNTIFAQIPNATSFDLSFVAMIMLIAARAAIISLLPIFSVVVLIALITEAMQTGMVSALDPLTPKLERINPLEGFKRMFSLQGFVELIKSIVKVIIVFWITWYAVKDELPYIIGIMDAHPWEAIAVGGSIAFTIAMRVGMFYLIVAVLDYLYKRWDYMKNLKMTRQEVKEEYKRLEGDPQVKQRIRDLMRAAANQRMMGSVPGSDVVVTNPIHLAVALKYDSTKMKSPKLMAKGKLLIAEQIKAIAERNNVPIVENEVVARAIFSSTKVGNEVPADLYQAVAEILAFVYKVKKDRSVKKKEWLGPLRGIRTREEAAVRN